VSAPAASTGTATERPAAPEAAHESGELTAPLYVAWQITNECNLACLHCIEESGPGKAFADELDAAQALSVLDQIIEHEVPYVSFSGGEPMLHPHFFEMVDRACSAGVQLKIETNAHLLDAASCERLHALGVKAVQVSLDGASTATYGRMRVHGQFDRVLAGLRHLREASVAIEINFSPAAFNLHEIGTIVDLAHELGAESFYTGRTMYTGNAVKAWRHLEVSEAQYEGYFQTLRDKAQQYRGRMRVHYHEAGLLEELRYRLEHPAALLIVLPNGLVKIINALPFICGDLRRQSLTEVWAGFRSAWNDPRVAQFIEDLATEPGRTKALHQWVHL
jgi:MoaA/NifB/PqqE/SkfB family radical SAM enzyme